MTSTCIYCNKKYTNKSAFTRHQLLCEFSSFNPRSKNVYIEETTDLPSHPSLVFAMQEMLIKMKKMDTRIEFLEKENSILQKVKMSGHKWLTEHVNPTTYIEDIRPMLIVTEKHVDMLFNEKVMDVMQRVLETSIIKKDAPLAHIKGRLYSYHKSKEWSHMTNQQVVCILNQIHQQLIQGLADWRKSNQNELNVNDTLVIKYNKTLGKLLELNFTIDNAIHRGKTCISNVVDYEVKNIIEIVVE